MNQRRFTVSHKTQKRMEHQNAKWPFMNVLGMFLVAKTLSRCGFLLISETDGACLHKASNMFLNMSKCYRFLVSVLSFSKPQLNFQKIETARILLSIRLWFFGGDFFLQAFFASFSNMNLNFGCSSCRKLAMWLTHLASRPQRPPMIAMACYGMLWNAMGQERWCVLNCFRTVQCNRLRIIASGMPTHSRLKRKLDSFQESMRMKIYELLKHQ